MIFEELSRNTVMVELTKDELEAYSVTYETLDGSDIKTQSAVKRILGSVKKLHGKERQKVTVEALPSSDGGCFFIFTFSEKPCRYRVKNASSGVFLETPDIDCVLDFISARRNMGSGKCRLYFDENKYLLFVPSASGKEVRIMSEYGSVRHFDSLHMCRLSEHGSCLGEI